MSARTRKSLVLFWTALFVFSIGLQYANFIVAPAPALAVHDQGIFELEGNAVDEPAAGDDWENGTPTADDSLFVPGSVEKDGVDATYFTGGGSKDENDIDEWAYTSNDLAPDKDELLDVFAAVYDEDPDGTIVFFGADKFDDSGDAQIGFWFFRNAIGLDGSGGFTGVHGVGDVLVLSDFTNGGAVERICVYEWTPPGGTSAIGDPGECDLGDNLVLVASGATCDVGDGTYDVCAVVNAGTETAPWDFVNKDGETDFAAGQFFEGGINLDLLFGGSPPCFSGFLAETRSSQDTNAQLKDFALGSLDTCGSITIIKDAVPNDAQDFAFTTTGTGLSNFSLDDDADATLSNTKVFSQLESGTYTVAEAAVANWQLTNIVCNDANGSIDVGTRTATINLGASENVTCTFTNTRHGRIIVEKQTQPDGSAQSFEFDPSYGANFNLTDGQQNDSGFLAPGTYSVAEVNIPAGWDLTSAVCSDGSPVNAINLALNETVTCVFTNTQDGRILVDKVTDPSGSAQSFEFDSSYGANFFLTDAALPNDSGLLDPGTYSVVEITPAGWDLSSVSCSDGSLNTAIDLDPGETVTCTFNNRQDGRIIVQKQTTPDGSTQVFEFDPSWGDNFNLTDGQQNDSGNLDPGTYSVAEVNIPAGWDLTGATCSDGSAVNAINLGAGEVVTCVFNNRQDGQIIVQKQTTPDGSTQSFEFDPSYGANFNLTDGQQNNSGFLDPGTYSVAEVNIPAGWDLTGATCSDESPVNAINLGAGETVTCVFNNRQDGQIIVEKQTVPDGSAQSFEFDPSYGANFNLTDGQQNNSGFLDPGTYSVAELTPAGWDLTSAVCSDGSLISSINLAAGETVTCIFTNTQRGHILVDKVTNPAGDPQQFTFTPSWGANFQLADATAPHDSGALVPATYSVSEAVPAGWDLTSATCSDQSPVNAISLQPGETVTCTFTNTKRGTIIVEKQTSPDGAAGSFTFTGTAAGSIGDNGQIVVNNLVPGQYTSTEADPTPAFDLLGITCDDLNSSGVVGTRTATFNLDPGETVKCTFTNVERGTITIIKNAIPDDAQDFAFSTTGSGLSGFSLDDDANATLSNTRTFSNVVAGSYSVTEAAVAGWDLTNLVCNGSGGASGVANGATANITMTAGGSVLCTFTNSKPAIQVVKTAGTAADGAEFVTPPGNVTYTYVVTNTGPVALSNVKVRDDNGTPANTADDFDATCPKTTLAAGESMTCTATVAVAATANRTNIATATGTSAGGTNVSDTDNAVVRAPLLTITKGVTGNTGGSAPNGDPEAKIGDTLTYTLTYDLSFGPVTNGVITDKLPAGVTYVAGSATTSSPNPPGQFTFDSYNATTRTLTWKAATVSVDGSVTYKVTVDAGANALAQPLVNTATIDSDQTALDDDTQNVFVETPPQAATATPVRTLPPTDTFDTGSSQGNPGFSLMLLLLAIGGFVLAVGFITPVPERVRRRDRRG